MSKDKLSSEAILEKIQEVKATNSTELNLSGRNLTEIPVELFQLRQLERLKLSNNQLNEIPESILQLQNLSNLDLSLNKLSRFPEAILKLQNLSILNLSSNQLVEIPETISQLKDLSELDLSTNKIKKIPRAISQLKKLTTLSLSNNQISEILDEIKELDNLKKLFLSNNKISEIPRAILQLKKLERLRLSSNQISRIPEEIEHLDNLSVLVLYSNQIDKVPIAIVRMKSLQYLELQWNPITEPPLEIVDRGLESIRRYYRQQQAEGVEYLYEAKLLIIGEGEAGKTTLAKKIQNPNFQLNQTQPSTEGIDVIQYSFPCDGHDFRINIWDFGGQEIYHATHQFFLTKRSLYALVIDNRRENANLDYWLNVVELLSENSPLLIIQNEKKDGRCEVDESAIRARFTNLKETLCTNFQTNRGLDKVIQTIQLYIQSLDHVRTTLPKTWVKVRTALETDSRNYISLETYLELCNQNGFKKREDALQLSGYLHDLGVCLHFQDDPLLNKTVILKPQWGTDAVYKALDNSKVIQNHGKFNRSDLTQIWHDDTYANMQDELLQLMIKFRLCYRIPNTDDYIAPQLLPLNKPEYPWDDNRNLILRYTYDFMPKGILTQFIVALHDLIEQQKYVWRSGVVLKLENTRAEIIEIYGQREIRIRLTGEEKKSLMLLVTRELENIHRTYKRLKVQKLIPCNCPRCSEANQDPHFYNFNELQERRKNGKATIECAKPPYHDANVAALIDDVSDPLSGSLDRRPPKPEPVSTRPEVFISYAWGGDSEALVNKLDQTLQEKGITIVRDKRDLGYKGRIKAFMERIGQGKAIIVVISEKYLKSENCLFELLQIAENGAFYDRIFPIVLDDAKIYKPLDRIKYVQHWETQINELDEAMRNVSQANLDGFRDDIDLYNEIRRNLPKLTHILKDMNTLTAQMHSDSDFEALISAIEQKLSA